MGFAIWFMVFEELDGLLTENEKKVYLALLQIGETTAAKILEKTGLQNSVFYRTIHRLIEKGVVSFVKKGQIKHFSSAKPEVFVTQLRDRQEAVKQILPDLKEIQKVASVKTDAEVFVGIKGVKAMYHTLIEDSRPGEEYLFFGTMLDIFEESMSKIYLPFRKYRAEKKIIVYGIHKKEFKGKVTPFVRTKERYTDFPLPPNMAIFRDKVAITSWGEVPTGILIKSKDVVNQYRELFWELWKMAGKSKKS